MRSVRTISLLAGVLALALGSTALACSGDQTKVSGTFDASGRFVLNGAWDAKGAAIANTKGMVLQSFTTADNLVLPASTLAGKAVCLFGELDAANKTMNVSGFKECGASCDPAACASKGVSAAAAGGAGCGAAAAMANMQAAGGAHCASKSADAAAASAGQCASKGAAAKTASAGSAGCCPSGAAAKSASAKTASADGCGAAAKTASAGASCASKSADAAAASAKTAEGKADCATKATLVYTVSGMTCGGCATQVKNAVAKMANVGECTVDLEKAQAVVTTTGTVDASEIGKAITAAGFPAQLAPADAPAETAKS